MSTKIYNGYKIPSMTLSKLHAFFLAFSKKIQAKRAEIIAKTHALYTVDLFDHATIGLSYDLYPKDKEKFCPLSEAWFYVREQNEEIKKTGRRNPIFDFDCSVTFIPGKKYILCLLYTEQKLFEEIWRKTEGVEYYGYWNNTDPPEDITQRQWNSRGREWDVALGSKGIPSLVGFSFDTWDHFISITPAEAIISNVPSLEARATSLVKETIFDAFCKNFKYEEEEEKENYTWAKFFAAEKAYKEWIKTEEGQKAMTSKMEEFKSKLVESPSYDQLRADIKKPDTTVYCKKATG